MYIKLTRELTSFIFNRLNKYKNIIGIVFLDINQKYKMNF